MVYRRTYRRRRPTMRRLRRPVYRRRLRTSRRPRLSSLKVHHFRRTFTLTQLGSSNAGAVLGGYNFTLSQLPNYTEFTNLFDSYRINKILVKFIPSHNSSDVGAGGQYIPNFHTILDYNDSTAPASLNAMYEYQNWRMSRGVSAHKRIWTPASLDSVATTAGVASSNPTYKQWISTSSADIPHYGLKYGIEPSVALNDIVWSVYVTMYFSCKSVK